MNLTEARSVLIDSVLNVPQGGYSSARRAWPAVRRQDPSHDALRFQPLRRH